MSSNSLTIELDSGHDIHLSNDEIDLTQEKENCTVEIFMTDDAAAKYRFMTPEESSRCGMVFTDIAAFSDDVFSNFALESNRVALSFTAANTDKKTWSFWLFVVKSETGQVIKIDPSIRDN